MSETFWECNKAGHKQFTVGVCPDCHREVKYEIAELQAKLDEYAKWDLEDGRTITGLKERMSELDELREHFENKFSEQCRINLRLNAALAEIKKHLRDRGAPALLESQIDAIIDKARAGE